MVVFKTSLFSVCPRWLVLRHHFFRSSQLAAYKTLIFWGRNSQKVFFLICLTIRPLELYFDIICISLIKVKIWRFYDYRPWMTFKELETNFFENRTSRASFWRRIRMNHVRNLIFSTFYDIFDLDWPLLTFGLLKSLCQFPYFSRFWNLTSLNLKLLDI